jgi:surface antigen
VSTTRRPSRISTIRRSISNVGTKSRRYVFSEKSGMAPGQCTYYAAHKARFAFPETSPGVRFRWITGNANRRLWNAKSAWFRTTSSPSIGAIAVFQQWWARYYSAGHVAIVEDVDRDNKRMKVSDMNFAGLWIVTSRRIDMNDAMTATQRGQTLLWFIPVQALPSNLQREYEKARD